MSQVSTILNHLKKNPITASEAVDRYKCYRLAARIKNLRDHGYAIDSEMINANGKRFAKYRLIKSSVTH